MQFLLVCSSPFQIYFTVIFDFLKGSRKCQPGVEPAHFKLSTRSPCLQDVPAQPLRPRRKASKRSGGAKKGLTGCQWSYKGRMIGGIGPLSTVASVCACVCHIHIYVCVSNICRLGITVFQPAIRPPWMFSSSSWSLSSSPSPSSSSEAEEEKQEQEQEQEQEQWQWQWQWQ